jgi:release factor glutamine methyltransferase
LSLTITELLNLGESRLKEGGVADAHRDSRLLLAHILEVPESKLFMEYNDLISERTCEKYFELIDRRGAREPLQYITGTADFMGYTFSVGPEVLVPRRETETLVEDAISVLKTGKFRGGVFVRPDTGASILDLCTGSGAIAVSLTKELENVRVTASDVSAEAIAAAKKNAGSNGVSKRVNFVTGDMFEPFVGVLGSRKFDMIISNPPYIASGVIPTLEPEVAEHEPRAALDGGEDSLDFYRIIAAEAPKHLKKGGVLALEIGFDQKDSVNALLEETGCFPDIRSGKDLAGLDRVIFAAYAPPGKRRPKHEKKR